MTKDFLKVNGEDYHPLKTIRRITTISEQERTSLANLGEHVDADSYGSRIDYEDGSKSYALETISDYQTQGARLIQVDEGVYIPADNIVKARNISDEDRRMFQDRTGRPMRGDFKSSLDTKAGRVLATLDAKSIMASLSPS